MLLSRTLIAPGCLIGAVLMSGAGIILAKPDDAKRTDKVEASALPPAGGKTPAQQPRTVIIAQSKVTEAERQHLEIFRLGEAWEKAGILGRKDYVILRQIGASVQKKRTISDRDLQWSITLLKESNQPLVNARLLAMLTELKKVAKMQHDSILKASTPFLMSKNALERNAAKQLIDAMTLLKSKKLIQN